MACCCSSCSNCPDGGVIPPIIHVTLAGFNATPGLASINGTYPLGQGDFGGGPYKWSYLGLGMGPGGQNTTVEITLICPDGIAGSPPGSPWVLIVRVATGGPFSELDCTMTNNASCAPPDIRFALFHFAGTSTVINGSAVVSA